MGFCNASTVMTWDNMTINDSINALLNVGFCRQIFNFIHRFPIGSGNRASPWIILIPFRVDKSVTTFDLWHEALLSWKIKLSKPISSTDGNISDSKMSTYLVTFNVSASYNTGWNTEPHHHSMWMLQSLIGYNLFYAFHQSGHIHNYSHYKTEKSYSCFITKSYINHSWVVQFLCVFVHANLLQHCCSFRYTSFAAFYPIMFFFSSVV